MASTFDQANNSIVVGLVGAVALWTGLRFYRLGKREPYLPPGPPTKPVIGNLLEFQGEGPHHGFTKLAREYGGMYSLKLLNQTMIVLSSLDSIQYVLDKNSALSSDRPPWHMGDLIEGVNNNLITAKYGERWRSQRRAAQQVLSAQACRTHLSIQLAESKQLLYDILTEPENIQSHLRRLSTSIIKSVMFGVRIPSALSPFYKEFWQMLDFTVYMTAETIHPPVDLVPILKYVPERFAKWKTECRDLRTMQRDIFQRMLDPVEQRLAREEGNGCFMETVYQKAEQWHLDKEALFYFGAAMMEAGAETTSTFITNFALILTAHPRVQAKIHEEMDAVIGNERMPELDDYESLPYLQAVVNETHRFRPVTPLAIPHATTEDIQYGKYLIPKGAMVFQNTWGLFHDENVFQDPESFYPERFIEHPELTKYIDYAFGSGRRICVGIHLAKNSIAINAMNLAWAFSMNKSIAKDGSVIEPNLTDYLDGVANVPKEVNCTLVPRSPVHERMLRQAFHDTGHSFQPFEQDLEQQERLDAEERRRLA